MPDTKILRPRVLRAIRCLVRLVVCRTSNVRYVDRCRVVVFFCALSRVGPRAGAPAFTVLRRAVVFKLSEFVVEQRSPHVAFHGHARHDPRAGNLRARKRAERQEEEQSEHR